MAAPGTRGMTPGAVQDGPGRPSYTAEKIFQILAAGGLPVPTGTCILVQITAELRTGYGGCVLFQLGCHGVESSVEGQDKSCAHAAKDLSNTEYTTRMGRAGPVSRKRLLYRFASRKAFPQLRLCAERPKTRSPKSCIKLWARGGYQSRAQSGAWEPEEVTDKPLSPFAASALWRDAPPARRSWKKHHAKAPSSQRWTFGDTRRFGVIAFKFLEGTDKSCARF